MIPNDEVEIILNKIEEEVDLAEGNSATTSDQEDSPEIDNDHHPVARLQRLQSAGLLSVRNLTNSSYFMNSRGATAVHRKPLNSVPYRFKNH
jgi:hypothetical protein